MPPKRKQKLRKSPSLSPDQSKREHSDDLKFSDLDFSSFDAFVDKCESDRGQATPETYCLNLCYVLGREIQRLNTVISSSKFNHQDDKKRDILAIEKYGLRKTFYYQIMNNAGDLLLRTEMEQQFDQYIQKSDDGFFYCKKAPYCDHHQDIKSDRAGQLYKHLRSLSGTKLSCYYCDYASVNFQSFRSHISLFHWNSGFDQEKSQHKPKRIKPNQEKENEIKPY